MKKVIFLMLLFGSFLNSVANEKSTNWFLKAGAYGNFNIYFADFEKLPGYEVCCSGFSNGAGFGPAFMLGGEYKITDGLFGRDTRYSFELLYSDMSAKFVTNDHLGYDIEAEEYREIYADYVIDPTINGIITEHTLKIYLLPEIPLSFKAGFNFGFPLTRTFEQFTEIVEPDGITFENGSKVSNEYSGNLPNAASFYYGITFGVGYDLYQTKKFAVSPEIKFNYGLNNAVNNLNWNIANIQAGVSIAYNIPKAKVAPPARPPMPAAPEMYMPPEESIVEIDIEFQENRKDIGNEINYDYIVNEYYDKELMLPVIFIDGITKGNPENYNPDKIIALVINKLKSEDVSLSINAGISNNSDRENVKSIVDEIISSGVSEDRINIYYDDLSEKTFKYPELESEANAITFNFSDDNNLLTETRLINKEEVKNDKIINARISLKGTEDNFKSEIYAELNGKRISLKEGDNEINIKNATENQDNTFSVSAKVTNQWNKDYTADKKLNINLNKTTNKFINYNTENKQSRFILGFFDFDSDILKNTDNEVISKVRNALAEGREITILALTDNLGVNYYNKGLARKRAESAINALGISIDDAKIIIRENGIYQNNFPYGRMLNRSVIIEISD